MRRRARAGTPAKAEVARRWGKTPLVTTEHALFWAAGMIVGGATVGMMGKSFVEERGRKLIPTFVALAVVAGLIVGWALNAWIDYIHFTANGGSASGL